jgi:DNA polymerase elongation subunit (family B)
MQELACFVRLWVWLRCILSHMQQKGSAHRYTMYGTHTTHTVTVCAGSAMAFQVLQRCLNARQFGLKMIANVSYGYTSASFSGRMPCAELADAIVQVRVLGYKKLSDLQSWC